MGVFGRRSRHACEKIHVDGDTSDDACARARICRVCEKSQSVSRKLLLLVFFCLLFSMADDGDAFLLHLHEFTAQQEHKRRGWHRLSPSQLCDWFSERRASLEDCVESERFERRFTWLLLLLAVLLGVVAVAMDPDSLRVLWTGAKAKDPLNGDSNESSDGGVVVVLDGNTSRYARCDPSAADFAAVEVWGELLARHADRLQHYPLCSTMIEDARDQQQQQQRPCVCVLQSGEQRSVQRLVRPELLYAASGFAQVPGTDAECASFVVVRHLTYRAHAKTIKTLRISEPRDVLSTLLALEELALRDRRNGPRAADHCHSLGDVRRNTALL